MTTNNKPIDTIRFGTISAPIWKNTNDNGVFYSFNIERVYSDKDDNLKSTSSFSLQDALTVAKVANDAHTRIYELQQADKAEKAAAEKETQ